MLNVYSLIKVVSQSHPDAQKLLASNPELLNSKTLSGETALHFFVVENDVDSVKWLLDQGANVNTTDNLMNTPLIHAAQLGYLSMVKLLIKNGATVAHENDLGETALIHANQKGHHRIIAELRKKLI